MKKYVKKKLVTGGCGFVGRHLVLNLLHDGNDIWIIDNLFTGTHPDTWLHGFRKKKHGRVTLYQRRKQFCFFIQEDVIDFFRGQLNGVSNMKLPFFDEVYHCAAIVGGRAVLIENDPMLVALNHAIDSIFFLWAVRNKKHIGRILYVSSSVVYPATLVKSKKHIVLKEEDAQLDGRRIGTPESLYGRNKLAGEYLALVAAKKYGLRVACARPFSGYGPDQDSHYPIPSIVSRAIRHKNPLVVWGSGNQGRDFIYIDDFISALRIVMQHVSDGSAVNIATGRLTTMKEVARVSAVLAGYRPRIVGRKDKIEGAYRLQGDIGRLKQFGWKLNYSLEQGLMAVIQHMKRKT